MLIGALKLRFRFKILPPARVTVPILVSGTEVVPDSLEIAKWADEHRRRSGPSLFPRSHTDEILGFVAAADAAQNYFRAWLVSCAAKNNDVLLTFVPRALRLPGLGILIGKAGNWVFRFKYRREFSSASKDATWRIFRDKVMPALERGGGEYLVGGQFTYADIAIATAISAFFPANNDFIRRGKAVQEQIELAFPRAEELAPMLAWRDRLFAKHAPRTQNSKI
mmetsp:Transcript_55170/g.135319  ORF Transcript_55170/g.135319 Transcript_55170/m.135319 type:complete len:223 (+) Transcript_55170:1578-2246(+)